MDSDRYQESACANFGRTNIYTHFQIFLKEGESAAILQLIVFFPSLQVLRFDLVSFDSFGAVVSLAQPILQLPAFQI
jgi:hypothetical protein